MRKVLLTAILLACMAAIYGQPVFTDETHPIPGVYKGSVAWGDYDGDGDLDLLIAGQISAEASIMRIYRNDAGSFVDIGAGFPGFSSASVAWGDYDNDGDLDFAVLGLSGGLPVTRIYNNSGGEFSPHVSAALIGLDSGALAWGDADSDGDLDLMITGKDVSGTPRTYIYINVLGAFSTFTTIASGVWNSSVAWGDFDNDGDLDFVISGATASGEITEIWRNTNGVFAKLTTGTTAILGVSLSSLAWADFDNDGDLDLIVAGKRITSYFTKIYRNDLVGTTATFVDLGVDLPGVQNASLAMGDYDGDGDLDLLLTGEYTDGTINTNISRIYRNNNFIFFHDTTNSIPGVRLSNVAWGDYDGDGDLDIAMCGLDNSGVPITKIYKNGSAVVNAAPSAPTGLSMVKVGSGATAYLMFSWNPGTDAITPQAGLSYVLRIGYTSGGIQIVAPHANSAGTRLRPGRGFANSTCFWYVKASAMPYGDFYWSVQAIDGAFRGSEWAAQQSFNGGRVIAPNGGENWRTNTNRHVYWYSLSDVTNSNIYLSTNNGVSWTLQTPTPVVSDLGRYQITLPGTPSTQCLVKIEDAANPALKDISDAVFTISTTAPFVSLTSQNELAGKLQVGKQYYVTWQYSGITNLRLELSTDEGQSWTQLAGPLNAALGYYILTVPDNVAPLCYLRISDFADPQNYDWNDNPFSIVKLELLFPNQGDHVQTNPPSTNKLSVSWLVVPNNNITKLKIELSLDNGDTWLSLTSSTDYINGTYAGTIPSGTISNQCLVRISDIAVADLGIMDQSDGPFVIASLVVTSPNTSVRLQMGKQYPITWNQAGISSSLSIQYTPAYSASGSAWITIADNVDPAALQYLWTVPVLEAATTACRIRIIRMGQESFNDISDANFSIVHIKLLAPNGGEEWYYPPTRLIEWEALGIATTRIEISMDLGETWSVIASSVTTVNGLNSYNWTADQYNGQALIRVKDTSSTAIDVFDISDNPFTMLQRIQVLRPNGGETIIRGTVYNITWRVVDDPGIQTVSIHYTSNATASPVTWTQIVLSTPASSGSYAWNVPAGATLSTRYKIRIRRYPSASPSIEDTSDNMFTVATAIPPVDFSGVPTSGFMPLAVQFTDLTPMLSAPITSWQWNFGDGGTSTEQNPLYTYQNPGTFSVSLTVDNDLDAPRSLTKTNYIEVWPNYAQISLLSEPPLKFYANVGQTTGWKEVRIKNTGTANLLISSIQSSQPVFQWQFANLNTPIPPETEQVILVRFAPNSTTPVQANLTINSNAQETPALQVSLIGNDVPEVVPDLSVEIIDESAVLTWSPVTLSVLGNQVAPDLYVIEYNEMPDENSQYYYYLGATPQTTFTHYLVARFADQMFYRVKAVMNLTRDQIDYLVAGTERTERITWEEMKTRLDGLKTDHPRDKD